MAEIYVSSGVTSTGVIVSSYDSMFVLSAGTANSTTVSCYGTMFISGDGVANSTTVNATGDMGIEYGDVNNDGCDDILVRNLSSGALGYWDGNDNFMWHEIGSGVDSTWAVIA